MPDISELVKGTLKGVFEGIAEAEAEQLETQLEFVKGLSGENISVDQVLALVKDGKLADFFAAGEVEIAASVQLATRRTSDLNVGGNLGAGGFSITGSYQSGVSKDENTSATVKVTATRVSKSKAVQNLVGDVSELKALFSNG